MEMIPNFIKYIINYRWIYPTLFCLCIQTSAYAQTDDAINQKISKKLQEANTLLNDSPQASRKVAQAALEICLKYEKKIEAAKAHTLIGQSFLKQNVPNQSLQHFLSALKTFKKQSDWLGLSSTYNFLSVLSRLQSDYEQSLTYANEALKIASNKNLLEEKARAYLSIGAVYFGSKNYLKALEYFKTSKRIRQKIGSVGGLIKAYNDIGLVLSKLKKYKEAIRWYYKSLHINKGVHANIQMQSATLDNIGDVYIQQKKVKKANQYYQKALDAAQESGMKLRIMEVYQSIYELKTQEKKYKEALLYYSKYMKLKNSFINARVNVHLDILRQKHEIENANNNLKMQEAVIRRQRIVTLSSIAGLVIVIILLMVLYRGKQALGKQKLKIAKQNDVLLLKQEKILTQQEIISLSNSKLSHQNHQMLTSIRSAQTIQQAIFPLAYRMKEALDNYFIIYKPKDVVSGDFYWLSQFNHQQTFIAVVDCTGHGVPGAFMSMIGYSLLNEIINTQQTSSPALILEKLHQGVSVSLKQTQSNNHYGMDVCLCQINKEDKSKIKVVFAGARRPLFYISQQQLGIIKGDRRGIGGWHTKKNAPFTNKELWVNKGDLLYLTSDGYVDTPNPERKSFTTERLLHLFEEVKGTPINDQKSIFESALAQHQQDAELRDDITFIGLEL